MSNTTAFGAQAIHGTNPQFLVERVIRSRIYDSTYWKQDCFALNAATLIDKAVDLTYVGGTYGAQRPSPFLCLILKLLQIQPERAIVLEYLAAEDFKYLRAVAALYVRLTFPAIEVYELLEPMLNDYRKLRWRDMAGNYSLTHMDEFIDQLLTEERVCELILPRLTKRSVLESNDGLRPRVSRLEDALLRGEAPGLEDRRKTCDSDASDSDDSLTALRTERATRIAQADRLRHSKHAAVKPGAGTHANADTDADSEVYASQQSESEEEKLQARLIRSRTPSVSPDRQMSPKISARSSNVSPPAFQSRSPSMSPSTD